MDYSPPGSSVHGILQARVLEWVAFPPPGDLPDPGTELDSPAFPSLQVDSLQLNQLCTHTHTRTPDFFRFFSLIGCYKVFPVLYRRSLLVIYFIYINGRVFMLTLS